MAGMVGHKSNLAAPQPFCARSLAIRTCSAGPPHHVRFSHSPLPGLVVSHAPGIIESPSPAYAYVIHCSFRYEEQPSLRFHPHHAWKLRRVVETRLKTCSAYRKVSLFHHAKQMIYTTCALIKVLVSSYSSQNNTPPPTSACIHTVLDQYPFSRPIHSHPLRPSVYRGRLPLAQDASLSLPCRS